MSQASAALFSNTLILYEVLRHLPPLDLLIVQRVGPIWRFIIQTSNTLQTRLFLRPEFSHLSTRADAPSPSIELNPLLVQHFPGFFIMAHSLAPILDLPRYGPWSVSKWQHAARSKPPQTSRVEAYARPEASWRMMLPCRPAPTEIQVVDVKLCSTFSTGTFKKAVVEEGTAVRFGMLYDMVQRTACSVHTRIPKWKMLIGGVSEVAVEDERLTRFEAGIIRANRAALPGEDYLGHGCVVIKSHSIVGRDGSVWRYDPDTTGEEWMRSRGFDAEAIDNLEWGHDLQFRAGRMF